MYIFLGNCLMEEMMHTAESTWWQLLSTTANTTVWIEMVNPLWNKKGLRWFELTPQVKNAGIPCSNRKWPYYFAFSEEVHQLTKQQDNFPGSLCFNGC